MSPSLCALAASFLISCLSMPLLRRGALSADLIDHPNEERWHRTPTPYLGGVGIFFAVLTPILFFVGPSRELLALIGGGALAFIGGLYDDVSSRLGAIGKIALMLSVAAIPVGLGIRITFISPSWLAISVSLVWIFGLTNGFNMLDNADGLSSGFASVCGAMIFLYAYVNGFGLEGFAQVVGLAIVGASLGYLIYNFPPSSIFMGDAGSLFVGYSLALLPLMADWRPASWTSLFWLAPVLIFALPIFETTLMVLERVRHGKPFYRGDKAHSSHRLFKLGASPKTMLVVPYTISASTGGLALALPGLDFILELALTSGMAAVMFFLLWTFTRVEMYESGKEGEINNPGSRQTKEIRTCLKIALLAAGGLAGLGWILVLSF